VTASGAAAEPPKLNCLPTEVRADAIVLSNGEVMWARGDAPAALHRLPLGVGDVVARVVGTSDIGRARGAVAGPATRRDSRSADEGLAIQRQELGGITATPEPSEHA
jgi:hypothetical protein